MNKINNIKLINNIEIAKRTVAVTNAARRHDGRTNLCHNSDVRKRSNERRTNLSLKKKQQNKDKLMPYRNSRQRYDWDISDAS